MGNTRYQLNTQQLKKINSKLIYISTSKYGGDWHSILHTHPFSELFYVISGSGSFVVEDQVFTVKENDLVIVNPNVEHTEKSFHASPLEYIALGIDGLTFGMQKEGTQKNYSLHNYTKSTQNILFYLNIMLKEIEEKNTDYEIVCQNLLEVLLICIVRDQKLSLSATHTKKMHKECGLIKRYIDANYFENITLDILAELSHLNKFYLVHSFTKFTGLSPINYLIEVRIQEAKSLLVSTNLSIAQISSSVGFSSQAYFSQSFKKATGKTPNEFRKKSRIK